MLHFLLIVLALLAIWKLLGHSSGTNGTSLLAGLRRLALVLAVAGAALGGFIGHVMTENCHTDMAASAQWVTTCASPNYGGIALGVAAGFAGIWLAGSLLIWILSGFLPR
jgi:hypothetical protein